MTEQDLRNWNEAEKLQMDQLIRIGLACATTGLAIFAAYNAWETDFKPENLEAFGVLLGLSGTTWRMVGNTNRDLAQLNRAMNEEGESVGPLVKNIK